MMYWNDILQEVRNKNNPSYSFLFTDLGKKLPKEKKKSLELAKSNYYLYPDSRAYYLTPRECECVKWMLHGCTVPETAERVGLSARTVEYYLRNMRQRLNCESKAALLKKVRESGFLETWDPSR